MKSTLAELGGMFQRFTAVVAEQGETIERIDANTEEASLNVEEGHAQILKYRKTMEANRGLIIKSFLVLFFFIVLFGTVMR